MNWRFISSVTVLGAALVGCGGDDSTATTSSSSSANAASSSAGSGGGATSAGGGSASSATASGGGTGTGGGAGVGGAGGGSTGTKAFGEDCTSNAECVSGNCHEFKSKMVTICTQACDAANVCPQGYMCNMMGICAPQ